MGKLPTYFGEMVKRSELGAAYVEPPEVDCTCQRCGRPFKSRYPGSSLACGPCQEELARQSAEKERLEGITARRNEWRTICPAEFIESDPGKLPFPNLHERVLRWHYGRRGLILHGPTGGGKSRAAFSLCKREFMSGRTVMVINPRYAIEIPTLFLKGNSETEIRRACEVSLLLLDDCFKSRLSPTVEEFLFAVIDERTSQGRPIVATLNDTGDSLLSRLSPDRGEPMLRRLRENCAPITFEKPNPCPVKR